MTAGAIAQRFIDTRYAALNAEEEMLNYALRLFGVSDEDIDGGTKWPFDDAFVDDSDWEGMSLELKDCIKGLIATPEMCERAFEEQGFDVIDIQEVNETRYRRYYPMNTTRRHMRWAQEWHSENLGDDSRGWGEA